MASDELPSYQFTPVCQRTLPEQRANVKYELILRQQPKQSRMCGVGEKADRRPIDPPPIVQLIVKTSPSDGNKSNNAFTSYLQNPYYFMHASLVEKDTREDVLLIKDVRSKEDMHLFKDNRTKATTGSSVSSLYPLKDFEDNGTESGFFVFPDLSVRMEGTYRLKFCLYEMVGKDVHFCAFVISEPLVVYSAKKFPGMEESTQLSQYFAEQGLKIRIRKEVRPKKRSHGEIVAMPSSQSPTDLHNRGNRDEPAESHGDDNQSPAKDPSASSKRRASGSRENEPRRSKSIDDNSTSPQRQSLVSNDSVSRSSQLGRSMSVWRARAPDYSESQSISTLAEKSGPISEPVHQQQYGYLRSETHGTRRLSVPSRVEELPSSFIESSPSAHPEQRTDINRMRSQEATTVHNQSSYHPLSTMKQLPSISNSENQGLDQRSAVQQQELVRSSTSISRRGSGAESSFMYESRGPPTSLWGQKEYLPNVQSSDDSRIHTVDALSTLYSSRQSYPNAVSLRSSDHSYIDDYHLGPNIPAVFDRSDHVSRGQPETSQYKHSASQYSPQYPRNQQQSESHTFALQDQRATRQRPSSYHDSYSGFQSPGGSYPPTVSQGKYPMVGTPNTTTGPGRNSIHGHTSIGLEGRDSVEAPRRASTNSSPPRQVDSRLQPMSTSSGYTNFHRDREMEDPRHHIGHPPPGQNQYSHESPHSVTSSSPGNRHLRGIPSSGPYLNRHVDSVQGTMASDPFPRSAPVDYHVRSAPIPALSVTPMKSNPSIMGPNRRSISTNGFSNPEKNKGVGHYDDHYTSSSHSTFRNGGVEIGEHGYKNPGTSSLLPVPHPHDVSFSNNPPPVGSIEHSEYHQYQNHNHHFYRHFPGSITQNLPQTSPHGYGYLEQQRASSNQFYPPQ